MDCVEGKLPPICIQIIHLSKSLDHTIPKNAA